MKIKTFLDMNCIIIIFLDLSISNIEAKNMTDRDGRESNSMLLKMISSLSEV